MDDIRHQVHVVGTSPLFDADWYSRRHPDVEATGLQPAMHYLRIGARLMRDPGPRFSTRHYLRDNPDVAEAGINPLVHYMTHGMHENRSATPHVLTPAQLSTRVDVVVTVFNALEDVRHCLASIDARRDGCDVRVIVVNDGSGPETTEWVRGFCNDHAGFEVIEHDGNRGYTRAVNTGLRASRAPYVVTLNSDTIVTAGWLKGLLRCMASAPRIGIAGPLSNAASWQNVPELVDANGSFAVNQLPAGTTPEDMARVVAVASRREYPRVPFINGFCFMVRREVIDAIGYMDEAAFPVGYGEENDFCIRAGEAGFQLAVADDAYVFHAKSKTFGHERRAELSRRGSQALKLKHTPAKFDALVAKVKDTTRLDEVRQRIRHVLQARADGPPMPVPVMSLRVLFLLPVRGAGGGVHSVIQEVVAMRRLGVHAKVGIRAPHLANFLAQYADIPDIGEVLAPFRDGSVLEIAGEFDVVVGTIYTSMALVEEICNAFPQILPAYYVQDYEPLFSPEGSPGWQVARDSYELVPSAVLFAKTHWLVNRVREEHGVHVAKVEPSLDHSVYRPMQRATDGKIRLSAMIRPRTPRRGAERTMRVLSRLANAHPGRTSIHVFGCVDAELEPLARDFEFHNHGVLNRPEVAAVLASSDIFMDLSDYQAFGRTGLESMACGCAPLVPVHGGADEYAIDGVNAVVADTLSEDACFERLDALVRAPERLESMRQAALRTASRYSIHAAAVSELVMLSAALARHRRARPERPQASGTGTATASGEAVAAQGP